MPATRFNYKSVNRPVDGVSVTVPGQVFSIREIRARYQRGQAVQSFAGVYNPDFPPGYETMSKIERIEALRAVSQNVRDQRNVLQRDADVKSAADRQRKFDAAVKAEFVKRAKDSLPINE